MGIFDDMFGSHKSPNISTDFMNRAQDYYRQNIGPYAQRGLQDYNTDSDFLNQMRNKLMGLPDELQNQYTDPADVLKKLMGGYQESPQFLEQKNQALQAGNQSAAAGGMLGSPEAQKFSQDTAEALSNRDIGTYLDRALGLKSQGLSGQENLLGMLFNRAGQHEALGYQAGMDLTQGEAEGEYGKAMGEYQRQQREDIDRERRNKLLGALLGGAGGFLTGDFGNSRGNYGGNTGGGAFA